MCKIYSNTEMIMTIVILIMYNIENATTKVNNQAYRQIKKSNVHFP